ncbi:TPA: AlpA family phage regulatory protein [Vibrio vulnificus]|nr:AlpA family phage regulatory protein [Vibrio vulnificus]HAS6291728.1 AlpA family phage regulatory protein [Vibrio vulnificus]HAS6314838.1 AlpA family phage regulatory protein [Vibrio vulnificus]HDY7555337.1 AlpA family phage regulatory protein [Vibrio vulnificus]HDY7573330.1 AlpA family phage regulatory protein [Vibrio vulnificus]
MKLITLLQVKNLTGLSKTSIYKLMRNGCFPLNIKVGRKSSRWVESEVIEWSRMERLLSNFPEITNTQKRINYVFNDGNK